MNLYYYLDGQRQKCGPVQAQELPSLGVTESTLVWTQGMANWQPAGEVSELAPFFAAPPSVQPDYGAPATDPYGAPATDPYGNPATAPYGNPYGAPDNGQYGGQYGYPGNGQYGGQFAAGQGQQPPMPENYLVWTILATVLCCWPIGIYAIVRSNKVSSLYHMGDYEGAQKASNDAKTWSIIAAVAGLVFAIIYGIVVASNM